MDYFKPFELVNAEDMQRERNSKYHVGCGMTGIFAGTLNRKGDMWLNKSDVTDEALKATAQFLLEHDESFVFDYKGEKFRLVVVKADEEQK